MNSQIIFCGKRTNEGVIYAQKHKFTLMELLIVISIIMILASLLLPVLSKTKETSRQMLCAGNLKQVTVAAISYSGDYSDVVVPACSITPTASYGFLWPHKLVDYLNTSSSIYRYYDSKKLPPSYDYRWRYKGDKILYCPSLESNPNAGPDNINFSLTTYAVNNRIARDIRLFPELSVYKLYMINSPGRKVFFTEYDRAYYSFDRISDWGIHSQLKANFGFFDGHVGAFRSTNTGNSINWLN